MKTMETEEKLEEEENLEEYQDDDKSDKQYCANCLHCVVVKVPVVSGKDSQWKQRVKCNKGKWRKRLGDEKLYKYFSVFRRVVSGCEYYEKMGELKTFLKDLKRNLPQSDEVYKK